MRGRTPDTGVFGQEGAPSAAPASRGGSGNPRSGRAVLAAANGRAGLNRRPEWNNDFSTPSPPPDDEDLKAPQWFNEMRGGADTTAHAERDPGRGSASVPVQRPGYQQPPPRQPNGHGRYQEQQQQQQQQQQHFSPPQPEPPRGGGRDPERPLPPSGGAKDVERPLPRPGQNFALEEAEAEAAAGSSGLTPCEICGRNFAFDRIEKHRAVYRLV